MMQRAEQRKRELDIVYEKYEQGNAIIPRNRIKEREKEDALYEGKEKFITSAYKRKLEADRKYLDEVRRKEMEKKSNKGAFLSNLLASRNNDAPAKPEEEHPSPAPQQQTAVKEEEDDDMDGFILAPEEEQIKGNVEESSDDAGFIMAPKESAPRSRSRSRSRSHTHSHSRSHHHHHHSHHSHRHHSLVCSNKQNSILLSLM